MQTDFTIFRQLLQYELHGAERYRRFVSLVMVSSDNGLPGVRNYLGTHVRDTDVLANFDHSVAVLMGETDTPGAMIAIERYKELFNNQVDLRFSVVTYPKDGGKPESLVQTAYRRLSEAKSATSGTIVAND